MSFSKLVLWLFALNFLVAGSFALTLPAANASLIGIDVGAVASLSDLRSVYGGLRIGIGGLLAWAAATGHDRPGLVAAAALFAGNVLGRLVSLVVDGVPESPGLPLLGFELVALALAGTALGRRDVRGS